MRSKKISEFSFEENESSEMIFKNEACIIVSLRWDEYLEVVIGKKAYIRDFVWRRPVYGGLFLEIKLYIIYLLIINNQ